MGTKPPRSSLLISDVDASNDLAEMVKDVLSPSTSGDDEAATTKEEFPADLRCAIERYDWLIRSVLRDSGLSWHDAEDAKQDGFIELCDAWKSRRHRNENTTKSLIRTIFKRVVFDYRRQSERRVMTCLEQKLLEAAAASGGGAPTLAEEMHEEQRVRLAAALEKLPAEERQVICLRYEKKMQLEEIAAVLGCCRRTVSFRLRHIREALQAEFAPKAEE